MSSEEDCNNAGIMVRSFLMNKNKNEINLVPCLTRGVTSSHVRVSSFEVWEFGGDAASMREVERKPPEY